MTHKLTWATAALAAAACSQHSVVPQPPPAVRVEVVTPGTGATGRPRYSGVALPASQVPLAFRVPGYVAQLMTVRGADGRPRPIAEGDRVHRGDVLVRLRDAEFRDKVQQATGQAAAARAAAGKAALDWDRASRLFESHSVTKPEFDGAKAQHEATEAQQAAAQAALEEATMALRDTALESPLEADVVKKAVEPGALVGPGSLAFVVADLTSVKVIVGVPDLVLRSLSVDQAVAVTSDAFPGQRFEARINRIASAADPNTRNFDVEIAIPNPQRAWRAGMIASVELAGEGARSGPPLLPFAAIVPAPADPKRFAVVVVEGENAKAVARVRPVDLGEVVGNRVAVTRGLAPGERIVTTGASLLSDGERVEVVP